MVGMLPRERVELALSHMDTDRVPTDFWAVPQVIKVLEDYLQARDQEEVLEKLGIDMRLVGPEYLGSVRRMLADGSYLDPLGRHKKSVGNRYDTYEEYAGFPLANSRSLDELLRYENWPDTSLWDWNGLSNRIGDLHERYYIKIQSGGLFEVAWGLRGYEAFYMDMALNPEIPHYIMNKLCDFFCDYVRKALEQVGDKVDMVYTYDDVASQNSLLLSPKMWEEFIKPYHQRVNAIVKNHGKTIMYHSCGAVRPLIPALLNLPIDVLNPLQPLAKGMDLIEIKEDFGKRLCFHGAVDIQELLPHGSRDQIRTEVKRLTQILGSGGGYILSPSHNIQADTPIENILSLYNVSRK